MLLLIAADSPQQLLSKMRQAYADVKSARIEVMVKHPIAPGERATTPIVVTTEKGHMRIDLDLPSGLRYKAVTDGKMVSIENFVNPPYIKERDEKNAMAWFPLSLESRAFIDHRTVLSDEAMNRGKLSVTQESWNDKGWTVLEQVRPDGEASKFFIDPKTSLIWRTVVSKNGVFFAEHSIRSMKLNEGVSPGFFELAKAAKP